MIQPKYNLLFSNSLFIIPTIYGYYNKKYTLSTMTLISMLASMNYLRNPVSGTRQNFDLVISKVVGSIYILYGYNNLHINIFRIFGYVNGFLMISLYNSSCILYALKSDAWEYYHMMFHIATVIGKMIVLYG
jgi:predicted membrane channel-forming protein YqfA (hemolysin III family)